MTTNSSNQWQATLPFSRRGGGPTLTWKNCDQKRTINIWLKKKRRTVPRHIFSLRGGNEWMPHFPIKGRYLLACGNWTNNNPWFVGRTNYGGVFGLIFFCKKNKTDHSPLYYIPGIIHQCFVFFLCTGEIDLTLRGESQLRTPGE